LFIDFQLLVAMTRILIFLLLLLPTVAHSGQCQDATNAGAVGNYYSSVSSGDYIAMTDNNITQTVQLWTYQSITPWGCLDPATIKTQGGTAVGQTVNVWTLWGAQDCSAGLKKLAYQTWTHSGSVTCPPDEPVYCTNGVKDQDELGIDCGASCLAPDDNCTRFCPTNYFYNITVSQCEYIIESDQFGNCPSGYEKNFELTEGEWIQNGCIHRQDDLLASADYTIDDDFEDPPSNFSTFLSTYNSVTNQSVVDNGDGTSTITETTTTITNEGDTINEGDSSSTTVKIVDNSTGNVISSNTQESSNGSVSDDPSNYIWSTDVDSSGVTGDVDMSLLPEEGDLGGTLDGYIYNSAVTGIIDNSGVTTSAQICSIDTVLFSQTVTLDFCSTDITDKLDLLGAFLVSLGYLMAVFMVFSRN
jgi:hypothetical protein